MGTPHLHGVWAIEADGWPGGVEWWPVTRNLYEMFRDSVIADAIERTGATFIAQGGRTAISPWQYIPEDGDHIGRNQMMALLRRFMRKAGEEFPEGIVRDRSGFWMDDAFIEFAKTHRELGTDIVTMRKAWKAMRSIEK